MSKILSEKDINLLIESTICQKNLKLKELLIKYRKGIDTIQLKDIKKEHESEYYKIKSKEIIKKMIEDSSEEWIQEKPVGRVEIPCELCGSKLSRDKFTIRNRINNNKLLVGTSCIEKFIKIQRPIKGEKLSELIKLSGARSEIYERLAAFNRRYNGGKTIINKWENFYNSFDIVFPLDIENRWDRLNKEAKKFYKDYKEGRLNDKALDSFKYYIKDFKNLEVNILEFIERNKNNKFVCTKKIAEELKKDNLNETLNNIKSNSSILKEWHIKYIGDTNFISQFNYEINNFMKMNSVELIAIKDRKIFGEITVNGFNKLKIELNTKIFMNKFYDVISKKNYYKSKDFILKSDVVRTKNNVFNFIEIVASSIRKYKYYVKIDDEMYDLGIFEIHRNKKFVTIEIRTMLEDKNLFVDKINFKEIKNYMDKLEWKDIKDKDKYDIGNIGKIKSGGNYI